MSHSATPTATHPSPPAGRTGNILTSDTAGDAQTETAPSGHALVAAAEANPRIVGLTADLGKYTDIHVFRDRFPGRFFQMGWPSKTSSAWPRDSPGRDSFRSRRPTRLHDAPRV